MVDYMRRIANFVAAILSLMFGSASIPAAEDQKGTTAFDFEFRSIDGKPMPLSAWRGKALLVVNTASFCGYTKQYKGMQDVWSRYEDKGLVVIGVPANDFYQEPEGESNIKQFCEGAYGVTFPLTSKQSVTGDEAHPFYKWAAQVAGPPNWNFHKYLIGRDGRLVRAFSTKLDPTSEEITGWIDKVLAEKVSELQAVPVR